MHSSKRSQCLEKAFKSFNQAEVFTKHSFKLGAQSLSSFSVHLEGGRQSYEHCEIMRPEPRKERASVAVPELC